MHIRNRLYTNKNRFYLFLLLLLSSPVFLGIAQTVVSTDISTPDADEVLPADSLITLPTDTLMTTLSADSLAAVPADTVAVKPEKQGQLDAEIIFSAMDSVVLWNSGTAYLHGNGDIKYKDISLNSEYIRVNMDSAILFAKGVPDSIGDMIGEPIFGEGESKYDAKEITYNLKTKKGYVKSAVTQQGEGYIVSERTKKTEDDLINVAGAKYTTCDDHDHPHFYLNIKEGKIKPGSYVVSGPAHLVIADVPLPLVVPFGFFPFNSQYSSGLLMPSFVDEMSRGLGLTNGGYYFAFNDYVDLELRADIFTKGSWRVNATSSYIKRYKYSGSLGIDYQVYVMGEADMPDYAKQKNLQISWSHRQDAKANPYRTLSANVNFSTSGYNQNNLHNNYDPQQMSQNTKRSSISFSQRFARLPILSITGGMDINQVTKDSTINLQLPNLSINVSRFYPLKRKNAVGKERFYEKIYMSYSGTLTNSYSGKENKLFSSSFTRDWRNGMKHNIPIGASFTLFNYLTITPTFNYNERWHLSSVRQHWNSTTESVVTDTVNGFNRNYDFNMNVSMQTKLYGYYIPVRSIFGDKVDRFRHIITPRIGFSYNPDFTDPKWGMWGTYNRTYMDSPAPGYEVVRYNKYQGTQYGGATQTKTGSITFGLDNNLEMKVRNDKDTTGKESHKIISLIDNFSLNGSYNLLADSMNLSSIGALLRIKLPKNRSISLSGSFDPYLYKLDANDKPYRSGQYTWSKGIFPYFSGTNASYSISLNNDTFKKLFSKKDKTETTDSEQSEEKETTTDTQLTPEGKRYSSRKEQGDFDADGYERIKIPWNLNINYSLNYSRSNRSEDFNKEKMRYKMKLSHNLSLSANVTLTKNWHISGTTYFDFEEKKFTQLTLRVVRNLHCWSLSADIMPIGYNKSYYVKIGVNSSMLADLKLEKRNSQTSNRISWY